MFHNLKGQLGRELFNRRCAGVLDTPPVRLDSARPVMVLSQLQHKDVLMYLVAVKTFAAQVPLGAAMVLDDGSLEPDDHALLARHLPGVVIEPITAHRSARCPSGGTWERLLGIARHCADRYVMQLDADTLTLDALPEVVAAIAANRSFALGTWDDQRSETFAERAADARRLNTATQVHVQVAAEQHFDRDPAWAGLRYIRGCSGFAGFARGATSVGFIEDFSERMARLLGERWREWGSEQVMSNIALANSPDVMVLPHPRYCDCLHRAEHSAFVHFIGDCRFQGSAYRDAAAARIGLLGRAGA